jgi:hypothetical protein
MLFSPDPHLACAPAIGSSPGVPSNWWSDTVVDWRMPIRARQREDLGDFHRRRTTPRWWRSTRCVIGGAPVAFLDDDGAI